METNRKQGSSLHLIGDSFQLTSLRDMLPSFQHSLIYLRKVYTNESAVACIDRTTFSIVDNHHIWLLCETLSNPINISRIIEKEALDLSMGDKQMIVKTKTSHMLVNWGSPKIIDAKKLIKVDTSKQLPTDSFFQVFIISSALPQDWFYYCESGKMQNTNKLFHYSMQQSNESYLHTTLIGYPYLNTWTFKTVISGISIGKNHALVWDNAGGLYSRGSKQFILGHQNDGSSYSRVEMGATIMSAYAAQDYSLALSSNGVLYEWGTKKEPNEINDELIFKPRILEFKYFLCKSKFIVLKGKGQKFGVISSLGELYLWGQKCRKYLARDTLYPIGWEGEYVYEPVLQLDFIDYKVLDFTVETQFVGVTVANKYCRITFQNEKKYWKNILSSAEEKISKFYLMKKQINIYKNQKVQKKLKLIKKIKTEGEENIQRNSFINQSYSNSKINTKKHRRLVSQGTESIFSINKKNTVRTVNMMNQHQQKLNKQKLKKITKMQRKIKTDTTQGEIKDFSKQYEQKLAITRAKRQSIEIQFRKKTFLRLKQYQLQIRIKQKQEQQQKKQNQKCHHQLKQYFYKTLIKQLFIQLFLKATSFAREKKIQLFATGLKYQKIQNSLKNVFGKTRINLCIKQMSNLNHLRFSLLQQYFKKHVKNFRERKIKRHKNELVTTLIKHFICNKIKCCLVQKTSSINGLRILSKWICHVNVESKKYLQQCWNHSLSVYLHPTPTISKPAPFSPTCLRSYYNGRRDSIPVPFQFLPYSRHYSEVRFHRQYSLSSCPEQLEREALHHMLTTIVRQQAKKYQKDCRRYAVELAYFIRDHYQEISQMRWKFILQYNTIKDKKLSQIKQVKRLLESIGCAKLLQEDCIPEKGRILQYAQSYPQAPKNIESYVTLHSQQFIQHFKHYYQQIKKNVRRYNVNKIVNYQKKT